MFNASITRNACIVREAFQPTIRRENTSIERAESDTLFKFPSTPTGLAIPRAHVTAPPGIS
jgi:hypothetical protein